jgi:hypothetical protein
MVAHTAWSLSPRAPHVLAPSTAGGDTFLLHNPFSNTTVPLPGMDAVCAKAAALGEWFHVFKVLLMSSSAAAADIVVIVSQSRNYPFALSLPGKGQDDTWTPEPYAPPFMHIIDIAFVGDDKLYGITRAEDLFCFDLSLVHGVPIVTRCERVIRHPLDCYYGAVPTRRRIMIRRWTAIMSWMRRRMMIRR